jgi:hypothetical protein
MDSQSHTTTAPYVHIASAQQDVLAAWHLLYLSYVDAGYIPANEYQVHTVPQALGADTLVLLAKARGQEHRPLSTITAIADGARGLPLDSVYPRELSDMRAAGRRIMEVGLFGCCDEQSTFSTVFDLMRYTAYYALYLPVDDMICGIPPHRVKLYTRMLGFEHVSVVKTYETVSGNPVALMRGSIQEMRQRHASLRAVEYFVNNPLAPEAFAGRFRCTPAALADTAIDGYLQSKGELPLGCALPVRQLAKASAGDRMIAA